MVNNRVWLRARVLPIICFSAQDAQDVGIDLHLSYVDQSSNTCPQLSIEIDLHMSIEISVEVREVVVGHVGGVGQMNFGGCLLCVAATLAATVNRCNCVVLLKLAAICRYSLL